MTTPASSPPVSPTLDATQAGGGAPASTPASRILWSAVVLSVISAVSIYMSWEALDCHTWFDSHEDIRYHVSASHFCDAMSNGQFPLWMPDFNGGYGYPSFIFLQPGYYFLASILIWIMGSVAVAIPTLILLMLIQGGIGAYLLARQFADRGAALFAAVMFLGTPYLYTDLYVRGDFAEMAAMLMSPWCAWSLIRLHSRMPAGSRGELTAWVLLIAGSFFAVFVTHPVTSLFLLPSLAIWIILQAAPWKNSFEYQYLFRCLCGVLIAIALSCIHWLPAIYMKKYINYEFAVTGYFTPSNHSLWPSQLFSFFWGHGISVPGPDDGMSFALGLPHFLTALAGAVLSWRNTAIRYAYLLYLALIFLTLHYCNWVWDHVPFLAFVQFPWRILSVISLFQLISIIGLSKLSLFGGQRIKHALLACLAITTFAVQSNIHASKAPRTPIAEGVAAFDAQMLYVPGFAANYASPYTPNTTHLDLIKVGRGKRGLVDDPAFKIAFLPGHSKYHIRCSVRGDGAASRIQINQVYFPGWRVVVDGKEIDDGTLRDYCAPEGMLKAPVPQDSKDHVLEAWYDGPPGLGAYTLFAVVFSVTVLLVLTYVPFKRLEPR